MTAGTGLWRVDLHAHTSFSRDAATRPARLVERAAELGLDRIAVTDHGEIEGAWAAAAAPGGERVIVGEEICCRCGTELIGLYLREHIPEGLRRREVVERVHDQGGIVYAPHPFAYRTRARWHAARALAAADVAEVINARAFHQPWNRRANRHALALGLPGAAGSDAHFPWEIGRAWTLVPPFTDAAGLRASLSAGRPFLDSGGTPLDHVLSLGLQATRGLLRLDRRGPSRPSVPG